MAGKNSLCHRNDDEINDNEDSNYHKIVDNEQRYVVYLGYDNGLCSNIIRCNLFYVLMVKPHQTVKTAYSNVDAFVITQFHLVFQLLRKEGSFTYDRIPQTNTCTLYSSECSFESERMSNLNVFSSNNVKQYYSTGKIMLFVLQD